MTVLITTAHRRSVTVQYFARMFLGVERWCLSDRSSICRGVVRGGTGRRGHCWGVGRVGGVGPGERVSGRSGGGGRAGGVRSGAIHLG